MERGDEVDSVWLIMHDEGIDAGYGVRAIYASEEAAKEALVTRTPSGQRSRAWGAHSDLCCSIEEREVFGEPVIDIRENDPPPDPNAPRLIRDDLVDALIEPTTRSFPLFDKVLRGRS